MLSKQPQVEEHKKMEKTFRQKYEEKKYAGRPGRIRFVSGNRESEKSLENPLDFVCEDCSMIELLIVDDESFNLLCLEDILKNQFELKCETASNGQIALEMFEKNMKKMCCQYKYKMVITDINMPIMDGYQLAENIIKFCRENRIAQVPVIAVTSFESNEVKMKAKQVGIKEVHFKPVVADKLSPTLHKVWSRC